MKPLQSLRQFFVGSPLARVVVFGAIFGLWSAFSGKAIVSIDSNSLLPIAALLTLICVRLWYVWRTSAATIRNRHDDVGYALKILQIGMLAPVLWVATPLLGFADYPSIPWMQTLGAFLYILGIVIFWRSHANLGDRFSPTLEVKQDHELITQGMYLRIRHPMYLGLLLFTLGQLLAVPNAIAGPSGLVGLLLFIPRRIPREERMMLDEFGDAYALYCQRTKRLIPSVW